jgi:hypothetical protein
MPNVYGLLLRLRLELARTSVGAMLAGALMLAAASLWLVVLPEMSARVDEHAHAVALARSAPAPKPVVSAQALADERLASFYAALGDAGHTERIVQGLFDAASDAGVVLDKAEYKPAQNKAGRFDTYTINLPVKGDYTRLRRFSERVLLTIPYAALDDMRFKRDSANDQAVEAGLRFTVFLRPDTTASTSTPTRASNPTSASAPSPASNTTRASATSSASASASALPSLPSSPSTNTSVVEVRR